MSNLILLLVCLIIGYVFKQLKTLPDDAPMVLNKLIVNLFLPAITLRHAVNLQFSQDTILPVLAAWLVFGAAFIFFNATKKITGFDRQTIGALIVVAGISSISFVGFPIFELLYGAEGLKAGIVMSQAGTFVVCSTVGILTVSLYAQSDNGQWTENGKTRRSSFTIHRLSLLKDILFFPPFAAFVLALVLKFFGYHHTQVVSDFLEKFGSPLSVAALLSIGLQMDFSSDGSQKKALLVGLFFKLILSPLLIFVLFFVCFKQTGIPAKVSVLGSSLGSMNTIGIVAIQKNLNPALVTKMLAISIPLSLLLVPIVYWILG